MTQKLKMDDDSATILYHAFQMMVYFMCTVGAIISDTWLGKFKTIFFLSIIYASGSILISVGAIPSSPLPPQATLYVGLLLIALGSGGIKPCVSSFGGDQFKMPEQAAQLALYFSMFYFSINSGSLISMYLTPVLREDVHCFGENSCYSLAFGIPAVLMITSLGKHGIEFQIVYRSRGAHRSPLFLVIFLLGKPLYKMVPPSGNMLVNVATCIKVSNLVNKIRKQCQNQQLFSIDCDCNETQRKENPPSRALPRLCDRKTRPAAS